MNSYIVLYRDTGTLPLDPPRGFQCMASSADEAEELCIRVCPDSDVVWVCLNPESFEAALTEYYASVAK